MNNVQRLMSVKETAAYLGIGATLCRKMVADPGCKFVLHIGDRVLVDRKALDVWIDNQTYLNYIE